MDIKKEVTGRCRGRAKLYSFFRFLIIPIGEIDKAVPERGRIIDYGCGFGTNSCYLALSSKRRQVVGFDSNRQRIEEAKKMPSGMKNLRFDVKDISKMDIEKADVHLLIDVLHHMPYEEQASILEKITKNMEKNDLIIIKDIDHKPLLKFMWNYSHDKIMTFNDKLYFRNIKWFGNFLRGKGLNVKVIRCENLLYPHIIIIGRK